MSKRKTAILTVIYLLATVLFPANTYASGETHLILLGDSRTEGMCEAVGSSYVTEEGVICNHWCYESGKGLKHMLDKSFPFLDQTVNEVRSEDPTAEINVVCMYGVNDTHNAAKYATNYNTKASVYRNTGVRFFFVSANPIADEKSRYKYDKDAYVAAFNSTIRPLLSEDITYIDTYSDIVYDFRPYTRDGVHYSHEMYRRIYSFIVQKIKERKENGDGKKNTEIYKEKD